MKNVATWDRLVRIGVGLFLLSIAFWGPKTSWGWLGVVPLLTGFIGSCPAYSIFGFRTCRTENHGRAGK
jgi:hypothetical protein